MNVCDRCAAVVLPGLPMASHIASQHPEVFSEVKQPYVLPAIDDSDIEEGSEFDGPNCI